MSINVGTRHLLRPEICVNTVAPFRNWEGGAGGSAWTIYGNQGAFGKWSTHGGYSMTIGGAGVSAPTRGCFRGVRTTSPRSGPKNGVAGGSGNLSVVRKILFGSKSSTFFFVWILTCCCWNPSFWGFHQQPFHVHFQFSDLQKPIKPNNSIQSWITYPYWEMVINQFSTGFIYPL